MRENNVNVQVYSSCNCSCKFCGFTDKCHNKIDPEFVLNYINKHPDIRKIVLTGGEPTLAIEECIKIIQGIDLNKRNVILQTNGWWGDNEYIKQLLKDNPPSCVHLSVDSEKQKIIPIEDIQKTLNFLIDNNITTVIINHQENNQEYDYYEKIFPEVQPGKICTLEDGKDYDCGTALLVSNKVGILNIRGWQEVNNVK